MFCYLLYLFSPHPLPWSSLFAFPSRHTHSHGLPCLLSPAASRAHWFAIYTKNTCLIFSQTDKSLSLFCLLLDHTFPFQPKAWIMPTPPPNPFSLTQCICAFQQYAYSCKIPQLRFSRGRKVVEIMSSKTNLTRDQPLSNVLLIINQIF